MPCGLWYWSRVALKASCGREDAPVLGEPVGPRSSGYPLPAALAFLFLNLYATMARAPIIITPPTPTTTPMMVFLVPVLIPPFPEVSVFWGLWVGVTSSDVKPVEVVTLPPSKVRVTVVTALVVVTVVRVVEDEVVEESSSLVEEDELPLVVVLVAVLLEVIEVVDEVGVVVVLVDDGVVVVLVMVVVVDVELACLLSNMNPTISSTTLYADALVTNRHSARVTKR